MFLIEKPEDIIKYTLGDIMVQNIVLCAQIKALQQENSQLKAAAEQSKTSPKSKHPDS